MTTPNASRDADVQRVAIADIAAERQRQVESEGWSYAHDDASQGNLARAAACYAIGRRIVEYGWRDMWPWELKWWKSKDRRSDLVKAGALIVAEIERLDRATFAPTNERDEHVGG